MIVYSAINPTNGKRYIGKTVRTLAHARARHKERVKHPEKYKAYNLFHTTLREEGFDKFVWEILYHGTSDEDLMENERRLIAEYQTTDPEYGYNMTPGGWGNGKQISESQKAFLREFMSGENNPCYGKFGADHPAYQHEKTEEGLKAISEAARETQRRKKHGCDSPAHIGSGV